MNKKLMIVILVLIVSTISFSRSFLGLIGIIPWQYGYSDVFNEDRINEVSAKQIPYIERAVEYPIITGFFIYFTWLIGKNLLGYALLTWIFLTLPAVITAITLHKLAEMLKLGKKRLFWFFIFAPSMIVFSIYNWDMIALMFMVLGIYSFCKNKPLMASMFIGLGFNAKLFPVILLPIMMLKNRKNAIKMLLVFILTFLVLNSYFMIASFDTWKNIFLYHSLREPNIDSAWHITGLSTGAINIASAVLFSISYIALLLFFKKRDLIALSFLSMLLFLLLNKIFSPQYILWLLPFFVLSQNTSKKSFYLLEAANMAVFFSTMYWLLASREQVFLAISNISTVARSLILAYLIFIILKPTKTNINNV